jgi:hypothetical protein
VTYCAPLLPSVVAPHLCEGKGEERAL